MIPAETIERIVSFGGGVKLDPSNYTQLNLERFAAFASNSGAQIIIKNAGILAGSEMERIAAFGKGRVIFEFE